MRILFFFQAEDGIRVLVRSRGLGDVYKRQHRGSDNPHPHCLDLLRPQPNHRHAVHQRLHTAARVALKIHLLPDNASQRRPCLLYTSDAADERSSVDLGGRRIIKKNKKDKKKKKE